MYFIYVFYICMYMLYIYIEKYIGNIYIYINIYYICMNIYIIHIGEVVSEQTSPFKTERKAALSYIQLAICG